MIKFTLKLFTVVLLMYAASGLTGCGKEKLSPGTVTDSTIIAGSDTAGYLNGVGTSARFNHPFGLAADAHGNLYIADQGNGVIRKMDSTGLVSTLAGMPGTRSFVDGAGNQAAFNMPFGVAIGASGNIYVADAGNNKIRMITPAGIVSTFSGTGATGAANGPDTASFNSPLGVAADASGNVYVADYENNMIRKISAAGLVSTLAGSGAQGADNGRDTSATFDLPEGIAVDASGNVYVADNGNNLIRKITPAGQVTTLAGSGQAGSANGNGTSASFNSPFGIAVDASGNVYVTDSGNNLIRKVSPSGTVTTFAGSGIKGAKDATGTSASFNIPSGLAIDNQGNVYVADENNNLIRKITSGGAVSTIAAKRQKTTLVIRK